MSQPNQFKPDEKDDRISLFSEVDIDPSVYQDGKTQKLQIPEPLSRPSSVAMEQSLLLDDKLQADIDEKKEKEEKAAKEASKERNGSAKQKDDPQIKEDQNVMNSDEQIVDKEVPEISDKKVEDKQTLALAQSSTESDKRDDAVKVSTDIDPEAVNDTVIQIDQDQSTPADSDNQPKQTADMVINVSTITPPSDLDEAANAATDKESATPRKKDSKKVLQAAATRTSLLRHRKTSQEPPLHTRQLSNRQTDSRTRSLSPGPWVQRKQPTVGRMDKAVNPEAGGAASSIPHSRSDVAFPEARKAPRIDALRHDSHGKYDSSSASASPTPSPRRFRPLRNQPPGAKPRLKAATAKFSPLVARKRPENIVAGTSAAGMASLKDAPQIADGGQAIKTELDRTIEEIEQETKGLHENNGATKAPPQPGSAKEKASENAGLTTTNEQPSRETLPADTMTTSTSAGDRRDPLQNPNPSRESSSGSSTGSKESGSGRFVPKLAGNKPPLNLARKNSDDRGSLSSREDESRPTSSAAGTEVDAGEDDQDSDIVEQRNVLSQKLLNLAKKSEWILVDNILRYAKPSKLNLSVADEQGFTALMFAIKDGKLGVAERLLELGANISDKTKDGRTLAHITAQYSIREDTMRFLIYRKLDVSKPGGPKKQLPLHMACARVGGTTVPLVQMLVRAPTSNNTDPRFVEDKDGAIAIHEACEAGNTAVTRELLSTFNDTQARRQRRDTGDTPLHIACKHANVDLVRLLIENGALPNTQNEQGQTPLHIVAAAGDESLLRIFYQLRADANICDKNDKTPLHIAAEMGHTNVVELLTDKFKASVLARTKDGSTLMHIAAKNGHANTALAFMKRGVPMNMPNKTGALGLHCASMMGHVGVVQTLLSKGTPVDTRTKDNYTALHVAVQSGQPQVVECLLGYGADVHVRGGRLGETPLHIAAGLAGRQGKLCAEMLLKSGAETNVQQENGETSLHIATRKGNPHMIRLLLHDDADPLATSKTGETSLHVAARFCQYEVCKLLLQYIERTRSKEDATMLVNQQTTDGETALHCAAELTDDKTHYENEHADIMGLLIEYGGDVNLQTLTTAEAVMHYCARSGNVSALEKIVNKIGPGFVQIALNKQSKSGWSPLMEACSKGHLKVVEVLLEHHARVDVFDELGKTSLHLAAESGHKEVCDLLLKNKSFVNSKSKSGATPLHLAAMHGHEEVVTLLITQHAAALEAGTLDSQTPLHFAAKHGQLTVSSTLLSLNANANCRDSRGQTPLHLAAENDYPDVVKLFLKMKSNLSALTAMDENGFTCAHIAAMKGSLAVVKELMVIDKSMVIEAKTKTTESTALHMAAAGGHRRIVKFLLSCDAISEDENATGLSPLHVAAYYGQTDVVRAILQHVPATARSEPPGSHNPLIVKELATEYGMTPLHMAAQSGHEGLVRILLNYGGVQVDANSATMNVIPLHLAAQMGHVAVVGMLLSRSTQQLHVKDSRGRTALHLAAMNGHYDMVSVLIAQGSNINAMDQNGWTALHFATKAGHMNVLKLLLLSSADPQAETKEGKIALCFAAAHNHLQCLSFLMTKDHDTYQLMDDGKFIFDLMVCGKAHANRPIEEFILKSPAPIDTAVKLSSVYTNLSEKEKERARDLIAVGEFCENMAVELLSIAATEYNPAILLKAHDSRGKPFLDVLIENDQKEVVSHPSVQRYLTEIWSGGVQWGLGTFTIFFFALLFFPPLWVFFSLPLNFKEGRAPIIKFVCHLISHVYQVILLIIIVLNILEKIYEVKTIWPHQVEWLLLLWLSGLLVAELSSFGGRTGLATIRTLVLILSAIAIMLHILAFVYPYFMMSDVTLEDRDAQLRMRQSFLYMKNQLFAFVLLLCFILFLDSLTVHHLFGPWTIIIQELMFDLGRFLVILSLFVAGFTLHVTSIYQPAFHMNDHADAQVMRLADPLQAFEMLVFSLFGLVEPDTMPPLHLVPDFAKIIMKIVFGFYMMVTLIVLINLLIAMMSDTYQRIQAQSDKEWKFGRAKLIRQMNKKSATPTPINIFTKFYTLVKVAMRNRLKMCTTTAQDDLRKEENTDAFSMSGGNTGRMSPVPVKEDEGRLMENVELGHSSEWKLDTVIDWRHCVNIYHMFKGEDDDDDVTGDNDAEGGGVDDRIDAAKAAVNRGDRQMNGDLPKG